MEFFFKYNLKSQKLGRKICEAKSKTGLLKTLREALYQTKK